MPRSLSALHGYQVAAIRFILANPLAACWLEMGLGKTAVSLHAIRYLQETMKIYGTLVLAPLRVIQAVWRHEAKEWDYTLPLTFSLIHGSGQEKAQALRRPAVVYLMNYENLSWLEAELESGWLSRGKSLPFDMIVFDEISRLKSTRTRQGSIRGKALRRFLPHISRRVGLTGSAAANGLLDLFGQYLVLDDGKSLGTSFSEYQNFYFYRTDYSGYRWAPFAHSEKAILERIGDITLSMTNEEYLQLPPLVVNDIWVDLPPKARKKYERMEKDFFLELDTGADLVIDNAASLVNRCLQVANGAVYLAPGSKEWEALHDAKLQALEEIMEEAAGTPILLAFQFQHDAFRILKKHPDAKWLNSKVPEKEMLQIQKDWDAGRIPLLLGHPGSIGHGLNLQKGASTLVRYGLNWSQDLDSQITARLRRQGQTKPVFVHRILARDTLDLAQANVIKSKQATDASIKAAVTAYREKKCRG